MKEKYEAIELEIVRFAAQDVITDSNETTDQPFNPGNNG